MTPTQTADPKSLQIKRLLENPTWPEGLEARTMYERQHDDTDGKDEGYLRVVIADDGDAWVSMDVAHHGLRYRTYQGGGSSLRVRAALLILAQAIRLDNEERPQR